MGYYSLIDYFDLPHVALFEREMYRDYLQYL